jgi:glycosyltransferase involved in cell wall biosynthesis
MTKVSIITPTKNREHFLPQIAECVLSQIVDWEWLVLDDSPTPSVYLQTLAARDERVKYFYSSSPMSIGAKRNRLISIASGEFIAHFDDDDYYAPKYLSNMVRILEQEGADMVKFSGFYVHAPHASFFGYMDLDEKVGFYFDLSRNAVSIVEFHEKKQIGADFIMFYGFSYVYRKQICKHAFFDDIDLCDDESFAKRVLSHGYKMVATNDATRDCLHLIHGNSTARCFAKYSIPPFLLADFFPLYKRQVQQI